MTTLGQRIQEIRKARGYSQDAVAYDLGISTTAYAKIERNETDVNMSRLTQIAKVLKVNTWVFFSPDNPIVIMGDIQENNGSYNGTQNVYSDFTEERKSLYQHIESLKAQIKEQQKVIERLLK